MAQEKDLVLVHLEDKPLSFARIEAIEPDAKPGWFQIELLLLQVPLQIVRWILRDAYINGEPFTMDGRKMQLQKVEAPRQPASHEPDGGKTGDSAPAAGGQVISLQDRKPPKQ